VELGQCYSVQCCYVVSAALRRERERSGAEWRGGSSTRDKQQAGLQRGS
jgi:hypothetical protein